jgi:hypothetical protein
MPARSCQKECPSQTHKWTHQPTEESLQAIAKKNAPHKPTSGRIYPQGACKPLPKRMPITRMPPQVDTSTNITTAALPVPREVLKVESSREGALVMAEDVPDYNPLQALH